MKKVSSKILAILLSFAVIFSMMPGMAMADDATITVKMTVSNQGVLATANDGSLMANRDVTVTDINGDGNFTYDEALVAAHKAYNSESGYAVSSTGWVTKLWGVNTENSYFAINNSIGSELVNAAIIINGDNLVASINADNQYYADWYTFFDKTAVETTVGTDVTLSLKGFHGMLGGAAVAVKGVKIGTNTGGTFTQLGTKTTDASGNVTVSFDQPGTYYVTAKGTVSDTVVTNWSTGDTAIVDCPIIAPACIITVKDAKRVKMTVSNKGVLATANDGSVMANRDVTVEDINGDGSFTYDEALVAAHKAYNSESGYKGGSEGWVTKLWGVNTENSYFAINNSIGSELVNAAIINNGDNLVASINADNQYWADWYTYFDKASVETSAGTEITLNLKGFKGMDGGPATEISGVKIGTSSGGAFTQLGTKTTDTTGNVTISFDQPGTYYVTAKGTVSDTVVTNWSTGDTAIVDCPIIAPVCVVTVKTASAGGGGAVAPEVNEPTVNTTEGGTTSYDAATGTLTITPAEGYKVADVIVNGVSKGAVTSLTGLTKDDVVEIKFEAASATDPVVDNSKIIKGVKATTVSGSTKKTSKGIKVTWKKSAGYKVDKYQVYRSTSGKKGTFKKVYTTKSSKTTSYTNKSLKKGKTYYYKVRGVRKIDGKNYYTKWSKVSKRTFK